MSRVAQSHCDRRRAYHDPPSLLKFIELENHLLDVLGVQIDLVMKDSLKTRIGERVLKEVVAV